MQVLSVDESFRQPSHNYPRHHHGGSTERVCYEYVAKHASEIDTDYIYLPIYWTDNYVHHQAGELRPVKEVQDFLDSLDRSQRYVTVVQCADGIYERLPHNTLVFGAGGVGDVPLPLLCDQHLHPSSPRDLLASFVGNVECGGPEYHRGFAPHSSWNPDGPGAMARRSMMEAFRGPEFHLEDRRAISDDDSRHYVNIMSRSKYALAPRGYGLTSFRLYEAIQMGCVPVYIYDFPWLPYQDEVSWRDCIVLCHVDDIVTLPGRLLDLPQQWWTDARMKLDTLVRDGYFCPEGMGAYLLRRIAGNAA